MMKNKLKKKAMYCGDFMIWDIPMKYLRRLMKK